MDYSAKYYFHVVYNELSEVGLIYVVPAHYWDEKAKLYDGYIPDNSMVDSLESLGYIESMQNVYEFNTKEVDKAEVESQVSQLNGFKHSKSFSEYIVEYTNT